ncbi:MAG: hypothetical protein EBQ89_06410 [Alphaproteobacteria bacterium]|nr:hypothetical protein [Alphaproteobacteria bacterium]
MPSIDERLEAIEKRNARVEEDKLWEISLTRRLVVAALIYAVAFVFLWLTGEGRAGLLAIWPALGYLLSTLSLTFGRNLWQKTRGMNDKH